MKIRIKIKKGYAYILTALLVCTALLAVQAFNSNPGNLPNEPARLGHSGDELQVNLAGEIGEITLQKAIDDGLIGIRIPNECVVLKNEVMAKGAYSLNIPGTCLNSICAIRLNINPTPNYFGVIYRQNTDRQSWFSIGYSRTAEDNVVMRTGNFNGNLVIIEVGPAVLKEPTQTNPNQWTLELGQDNQYVSLVVCGKG